MILKPFTPSGRTKKRHNVSLCLSWGTCRLLALDGESIEAEKKHFRFEISKVEGEEEMPRERQTIEMDQQEFDDLLERMLKMREHAENYKGG